MVSKGSTRRWITARKTCQYVALLGVLILFIGARRGGFSSDLVNLPLRFDPLVGLAHFLSSRTYLSGSILGLIIVLLTIIFGRVWCGWLCPLGTVLDIFTPQKNHKAANVERIKLRNVKYFLLIIILTAALLGNLTLLFLDPLTIFLRTLTVSIWPALDQIVIEGEKILYKVNILSDPVLKFDGAIRPEIFPTVPFFYRHTTLFAFIFLCLIALNWVNERFWCRYLCPLGGLLGLLSKLAIFHREVSGDCMGCALCVPSCPTGTIDPARQYASDPAECIMCLDCLDACHRGWTTFAPGIQLADWQEYDPSRRQALIAIGVSISAVALLRSDIFACHDHPYRIQPPGGYENDLLSKCIRCGECLRACPTGGLQPSFSELGLEGIWTPVLVPRLGYCDFSCIACGQVCPVKAIPPLTLDEKRLQIIGKAYIDENRCIAWADHIECVVCEEMCPLPEKAITLEERKIIGNDGEEVIIPLPHVYRNLCIGCGICEYKCPINGDAAIRVYTPSDVY